MEPTDYPLCNAATTAFAANTSINMSNPHYFESLIYKYGSDKGHDDHGYTDLHQMLFDPIRLSVRNVTEGQPLFMVPITGSNSASGLLCLQGRVIWVVAHVMSKTAF